MNKIWLLPYGFKKIGWVILIPTLLAGIYLVFNELDTTKLAQIIERVIEQGREVDFSRIGNGIEPWLNNVLIIGILVGCIFITCSQERIEDEMIGRIRLNALLLALYLNCIVVIIMALAIYDLNFIDALVYNLFMLPLLFLIIYRLCLWRFKKNLPDEE